MPFAKVEDGHVVAVSSNLTWLDDSGNRVTDEAVFAAGGWFSVEDEPPEVAYYQTTKRRDYEEWEVYPNKVVATYSILDSPLDVAKRRATSIIDSNRDAVVYGGIEYLGHTFQTRSEDRSNMMEKLLEIRVLGASENAVTWITADNAEVTLSAEDFSALVTSVGRMKERAVFSAFALKRLVEAAETLEDLASINLEVQLS